MEGKSDTALPYGFSPITFEPRTIDKIRAASYSSQDASENIHVALERPRSKFDIGSRSRRDLDPMLHMSRSVLTRQTH